MTPELETALLNVLTASRWVIERNGGYRGIPPGNAALQALAEGLEQVDRANGFRYVGPLGPVQLPNECTCTLDPCCSVHGPKAHETARQRALGGPR